MKYTLEGLQDLRDKHCALEANYLKELQKPKKLLKDLPMDTLVLAEGVRRHLKTLKDFTCWKDGRTSKTTENSTHCNSLKLLESGWIPILGNENPFPDWCLIEVMTYNSNPNPSDESRVSYEFFWKDDSFVDRIIMARIVDQYVPTEARDSEYE